MTENETMARCLLVSLGESETAEGMVSKSKGKSKSPQQKLQMDEHGQRRVKGMITRKGTL